VAFVLLEKSNPLLWGEKLFSSIWGWVSIVHSAKQIKYSSVQNEYADYLLQLTSFWKDDEAQREGEFTRGRSLSLDWENTLSTQQNKTTKKEKKKKERQNSMAWVRE
jgi:hypothetical protein